jgi:predicted ATPase/DNA-binding CsgD family transcriptional regulator
VRGPSRANTWVSTATNNLPFDLSTFVDRERELDAITAVLERARLVTLTGPAGVGKTRLALRAARQARRIFDDGVAFADLSQVDLPDLLTSAIAEALGSPDASIASLEGLVVYVGSRRVLLILDTCDRFLDACAELTLALLGRCPRLHIIATSRHRLDASGESVWPVPPLTPPAVGLPFEAIADNPAVQLFVARAAEVAPRFELDPTTAPLIAEICRRLEGLPLALELAAARAVVLTMSQIVERLDDPVHLLGRAIGIGPERHRSLAAALDWSLARLAPRERHLFRRLGVFNSLDIDAARLVCADDRLPRDDVPELIAELVAASLVQVVTENGSSSTRYRLLEPIRQYALEQLELSGESVAFGRVHAEWCRDLVQDDRHGEGRPEQLRHLTIELGNLRSGLAWAVEQQDLSVGFSLVVRLQGLWYMLGEAREARAWLTRLLALPGGTPSMRVPLAVWASNHAIATGESATAVELASQATAMAIDSGDAGLRAQCLDAMAEIMLVQGNLERAETLFREELELLNHTPDMDWLRGFLFYRLAALRLDAGALPEAERLVRESIARLNDQGNLWGRLRARRVLAHITLETGDLAGAAEHFAQCLTWSQEIDDRPDIVALLVDTAQVARAMGELAHARMLLRDALRRAQHLDQPLPLVRVLEAIAELLARARPQAAVRLGAAAKHRRDLLGLHAWRREQAAARTWLDYAQARVGSATLARSVAEGEHLDQSGAIAAGFALLNSVEPRSGGGPAAQALTPRELEVTRLLAERLDNRAIASALVISEGTVRAHVEHILGKLGLRSRVEITDWAHRQPPGHTL